MKSGYLPSRDSGSEFGVQAKGADTDRHKRRDVPAIEGSGVAVTRRDSRYIGML